MGVCARLLVADVTPVYPDCTSFVLAQRTEVYEDLLRALKVMNVVNERTPVPNIFYAMWLLENRQLSLSANINVSTNGGCTDPIMLLKFK